MEKVEAKSKSVGFTLREVFPVYKKGNYETGINYDGVKVRDVTPQELSALLKLENAQWANVVEFGDYYLYAYANHTPFYLCKDVCKIYSANPNKEASFDAYILLQILRKRALVKSYQRWQRKKPYIKR